MEEIKIPGVDTAQGIALTGGTIEGYYKVLTMFRKDADTRLRMLRFFLFGDGGMSTVFPEKHLSSLLTHIQALKSASATLGAAELSKKAINLEAAAKSGDLSTVQSDLLDYVEDLTELTTNIRAALQLIPEHIVTASNTEKEEDSDHLSLLLKLSETLKTKNVSEIDRILNELSLAALPQKTREILTLVSDQVLMTEFDIAIKTINEFLNQHE